MRLTSKFGFKTATGLAVGLALSITPAAAQEIKIGYSMAMTGGLGANGKSALLAQKIWEDDVNKKGGLLGRPVKLVYYDDQTNSSTVPGIYSKLLDVDKVDLVMGGYATNMQAPAMPMMIQRKRLFIGLGGFGVNSEFNYQNYFNMVATGPTPKPALTKGFFDLAVAQNPKSTTVAIVSADAEFARNVADGARENAKAAGLTIVYDKTYPPPTTDFAPIVRAIAATNPDIVVIGSYPPDSVGFIRSVNELGFKPKMIGGGMEGLQNTAIKTQLGPLLNGWTNFDFYLPGSKLQFPGLADVLAKYQARAAAEGVDLLGYYMAPNAYAQMQVLEQAITATKSLEDAKLADYIRASTFKTVLGDVRFGKGGEWAESRVLQVQYRNIKGNDMAQFTTTDTQVIVSPPDYASGAIVYPFEKAQ